MARFLPNLASDLELIRALPRKDTVWNWDDKCKDAFQTIKDKLTKTPVLAYFDPEKDLVLQADSSKDGLGAVLFQDGRSLEYAS